MTRKGRFFAIFSGFFIVAMIFTAWACSGRMDASRARIGEGWEKTQRTETERVSRMVSLWKAGLVRDIRMITGSDSFRMLLDDLLALPQERLSLFVKKDAGGDGEVQSLLEQAEYAESLLLESAKKSGFSEARILGSGGSGLLSGGILPPPSGERLSLAAKASQTRGMVFGSIYENGGGLFIDCAEPLYEMSGKSEPEVSGVFLASIPIDRELAQMLAPRKDISLALADRSSGFVVTLSGKNPVFTKTLAIFDGGGLPFGERIDIVNDSRCYSLGVPIAEPEWTIVAETPAGVLEAAFREDALAIWLLGVLVSVCIAVLGAAVWFFVSRGEHIRRNAELEAKNRTISEQKDMLDGMSEALSAGLALVDRNGVLKTGNHAFMMIAGQESDASGGHLRDILPAETWRKVSEALETATDSSREVEAPLGESLYRVGVFPGTNGDRSLVFQDITIHRQRAAKKAARQKALVLAMEQAIESVDPDLAGHSGKLRRLSAKMGQIAGLDSDSLEAMEIAASLSQVGKLFTSREILMKQGRLTDSERADVSEGMKKGVALLSGMDFGLPVPEIVAQMNSNDPLMREAALLALANAFIALTSRRKWRERPLDQDEALGTLADDSRFGENDIEILRKAVRRDWE